MLDFVPFLLAVLALSVVPGPAVLYIVTRSVSQGPRVGLLSVLGIHLGTLVHLAAAAVGLSALIASSAVAFTVVKYAGVAYLIYLGISTILRKQSLDIRGAAPVSRWRVLRDGALVEVLNPKVALFFLAFLPQFINPAAGNVTGQLLVLGALYLAVAVTSDSVFALIGGVLNRPLRRVLARQRFAVGGVYLGLGVSAALAEPPATR